MSAWVKIGLPITVLGAIGFAGSVFSTSVITACSSSSDSSSSGSSSGGSSGGVQCPSPLPAGTFPPPNCLDNDDESTCGTATSCPIEPVCGATDSNSCMALADNSKKTIWDFRIRQLNVIAPAQLASGIIQGSVVNPGIELNLKQCGEVGMGTFTWLLRLDSTKNTLTTGGAPLAFDPLGTGYCFANTTINPGTPSAIAISPVTVPVVKGADGSYGSTSKLSALNIPIYVANFGADGGVIGTPQTIVLPISGGEIQGMTVTDSGNCIGSIDTTALNSACIEESPSTCMEWKTAGSLGGFITLAQANKVEIPQLSTTLCALLSQGPAGPCKTNPDGSFVAQGDYCSTTQSAATATCADAFWLAATFAASAITINDGTTTPECQGASQPGGGDDAGADDAGADTSTGSQSDASDAAPE